MTSSFCDLVNNIILCGSLGLQTVPVEQQIYAVPGGFIQVEQEQTQLRGCINSQSINEYSSYSICF
jgi:hypothetical protein